VKLHLAEIGGEFCTQRTAPSLPNLRSLIEACIEKQEPVEIETIGVKILTPSFIDELIPPLIVKFGEARIQSLITFNPPLTGFLKEQIERGTRLRKK